MEALAGTVPAEASTPGTYFWMVTYHNRLPQTDEWDTTTTDLGRIIGNSQQFARVWPGWTTDLQIIA